MKHTISVQDLLFDVDQVPVEAVVGSNGNTPHMSIPGKKSTDSPMHRSRSWRREPGLPP
jgi:hypothetical protein